MRLGQTAILLVVAFGAGVGASFAQTPTHQHGTPAAGAPAPVDTRALVHFPEPLRLHTMANMRDHLLSLRTIDEALAKGAFDEAASIAEQRLGMSSLPVHGAPELAPYMPQGMQDIGTAMHRAASRFALEAQNAGTTGDVRPALSALGQVMQQCIACHAAYRVH